MAPTLQASPFKAPLALLWALALPWASLQPAAAAPQAERRAPRPRGLKGICADLEQGLLNLVELDLQHGALLDGPDPDDPDHRPPLICAAEAGQAKAVAFLLAKGAKVEVVQKRFMGSRTPLMVAAEFGHGDLVKLLLAAGASVKPGVGDWTPLMWAAYANHKADEDAYAVCLEALLAAGADPDAVGSRGETALTLAIGNRNPAGVVLLAARTRNPDQRDGEGRTVLSLAAGCGEEAMVEALLGAGAKVEAADRDGRTPWARAAEAGAQGVRERLVKAGAAERIDLLDGDRALASAARNGEVAMLRRLLESPAPGQAQRLGTALVLAARFDRPEAVRFLLDRGAPLEAVGEYGETPLMAALEDYSPNGEQAAPRAQLADLLLARGARVQAQDQRGGTALHRAITWKNPAAARLLLARKADPDQADLQGEFPLGLAASAGSTELVKVLLAGGARVDQKDRSGKTAWVLASLQQDRPTAALLEGAGALRDYASLRWAGPSSRIQALEQIAVTTETQWTELWKRAFGQAAPPMDFEHHFVACAFLGAKSGGAFSLAFGEPEVRGGTLRIVYSVVLKRIEGRRRSPVAGGQYAMKVYPKRQGLAPEVRGYAPEGHLPGLNRTLEEPPPVPPDPGPVATGQDLPGAADALIRTGPTPRSPGRSW